MQMCLPPLQGGTKECRGPRLALPFPLRLFTSNVPEGGTQNCPPSVIVTVDQVCTVVSASVRSNVSGELSTPLAVLGYLFLLTVA